MAGACWEREGGRYESVSWVSKGEHGYTYRPWPWSLKNQGENVQVVCSIYPCCGQCLPQSTGTSGSNKAVPILSLSLDRYFGDHLRDNFLSLDVAL